MRLIHVKWQISTAGNIGRTGSRKVKTWVQSYNLFREGKNIKQIAEERCLTENTALSHLSRYVVQGKLDIHNFVPDEVIEKVTSFKKNFPEESNIKAIFDFFDGEIPYGQIRMALDTLE